MNCITGSARCASRWKAPPPRTSARCTMCRSSRSAASATWWRIEPDRLEDRGSRRRRPNRRPAPRREPLMASGPLGPDGPLGPGRRGGPLVLAYSPCPNDTLSSPPGWKVASRACRRSSSGWRTSIRSTASRRRATGRGEGLVSRVRLSARAVAAALRRGAGAGLRTARRRAEPFDPRRWRRDGRYSRRSSRPPRCSSASSRPDLRRTIR